MLPVALFLILLTVSKAQQPDGLPSAAPPVIFGGWTDVPNLDPAQRMIVTFAFNKIDETPEKMKGLTPGCRHVRLQDSNFRQQVVAGMNYRFLLSVDEFCPGQDKVNLLCRVRVFDQPWTDTREVLWNESECSEPRSPRDVSVMTGGWQSVKSEDLSEEQEEAVTFAFNQLSAKNDAEGVNGLTAGCKLSLVGEKNFSQQVVSGMNYKFDLLVEEECPDQVVEEKQCSIFEFDQPWTKTREVVNLENVSCDDA